MTKLFVDTMFFYGQIPLDFDQNKYRVLKTWWNAHEILTSSKIHPNKVNLKRL